MARYGKVFLFFWIFLVSAQYFAIELPGIKAVYWSISLLLMAMTVYSKASLPFSKPFIALLIVMAWRLIEVWRSPWPLTEILVFYIDGVLAFIVLFYVVPKLFNPNEWLKYCFWVFLTIIVVSMFAGLVFASSSTRISGSGADKGVRWFFAHPNIAAMYPLTILTIAGSWTAFARNAKEWRLNVGIGVVALAVIFLTSSRGAELSATCALLFYVFGSLYEKVRTNLSSGFSLARYIVILLTSMMLALAINYSSNKFTFDFWDEISTGRASFAQEVLGSVESELLGVGYLPPGTTLLYDKSERDAGIDGLYINVIYTEGHIGLIALLYFFWQCIASIPTIFPWRFPYLNMAMIAGIVFGISESHFFLLISPLTIFAFGLVGISSTYASVRSKW